MAFEGISGIALSILEVGWLTRLCNPEALFVVAVVVIVAAATAAAAVVAIVVVVVLADVAAGRQAVVQACRSHAYM